MSPVVLQREGIDSGAVPADALVKVNITGSAALDRVFTSYAIDAAVNFASFIEVGESAERPARYYGNNIAGTITLLDAMARRAAPVTRPFWWLTAGERARC